MLNCVIAARTYCILKPGLIVRKLVELERDIARELETRRRIDCFEEEGKIPWRRWCSENGWPQWAPKRPAEDAIEMTPSSLRPGFADLFILLRSALTCRAGQA